MRFGFKGKTPASVMVLFSLLVANFLWQSIGTYAVTRWWPVSPDSIHSQALRLKGGMTIYVQPWLGNSLEYTFWTQFVLLALMFGMMWVHRDEIERVG